MFGFSKKNENELNKKMKFIPKFGTGDDFISAYSTGDDHFVIGKRKESDITITLDKIPCKEITIVNDDDYSIRYQCVVPMVKQGRFTYVIYDPDGKHYDALANMMSNMGYDVQIIDMESEENVSRVSLFEVANIANAPYWISIILSEMIDCDDNEKIVAHNTFMAMMQYLLIIKKNIEINEMYDVFSKIKERDLEIFNAMNDCEESQSYVMDLMATDEDLKDRIFEKIENRFFKPNTPKTTNPNIFTIAAHKKKTIFFVRRVAKQYRHLMTAMLFNLTFLNYICGQGDVSTLVINGEEEWYDKELLKKVCNDAESAGYKSVMFVNIKNTIDESETEDTLLVYMHTYDDKTKKLILDCLTVRNQCNRDDLAQISSDFYKGKRIPEYVLNLTPILFEDLVNVNDCIVIDTTYQTKAFRCDSI